MSRLHISNYYTDTTPEDIGESVMFHVSDPVSGLIIQQVRHRLKMEGEPQVERNFYECWEVSPNGMITPANTDSFFIPCSYMNMSGKASIKCKAWFLPCEDRRQARLDLSLEDADSEVSGVLPSNKGTVPREFVRPGIRRRWSAEWTGTRGCSDSCLTITSSRSYD